MLSQLLEDKKKKPETKTPSKKSKGKRKEGKARPLHILRRRSNPTLSCLNLRPKRKATQKIQALIPKE